MRSSQRDPGAFRRFTAGAALLLQLLVAGLLPLASAHETADLSRVPHLEGEGGSPSCPRSHNHYQCVVSRLLTTAFLFSAECRCSELEAEIAVTPATRSGDILPRFVRPSSLGSRAPPLS